MSERAGQCLVGEEVSLPIGLAATFRSLAAAVPQTGGSRRERDARNALAWLSSFIPAYARSVFSSERMRWGREEWDELERDVVQHTLLACLRYGAERWERSCDDHALRWTRKVVRNCLVSQAARLRARKQASSLPPPISETREPDVDQKHASLEVVRAMREQIPALVRRRDAASALALFDELVKSSFVPASQADGDRRSANRVRQRRRRARKLAARAWERVAATSAHDLASGELETLAVLLGLPKSSAGLRSCHAKCLRRAV